MFQTFNLANKTSKTGDKKRLIELRLLCLFLDTSVGFIMCIPTYYSYQKNRKYDHLIASSSSMNTEGFYNTAGKPKGILPDSWWGFTAKLEHMASVNWV